MALSKKSVENKIIEVLTLGPIEGKNKTEAINKLLEFIDTDAETIQEALLSIFKSKLINEISGSSYYPEENYSSTIYRIELKPEKNGSIQKKNFYKRPKKSGRYKYATHSAGWGKRPFQQPNGDHRGYKPLTDGEKKALKNQGRKKKRRRKTSSG